MALLILFSHTFSNYFTQSYHDRHQGTHYPLYYSEQQDQGRESSYWTVTGSRTGGASHEYDNWKDQELTGPSSSHFPFILARHPQQHQDLGEYQPNETRDREWTAAQRPAREYERGFLQEGWQRRWEPCSPVRYNREVSTKRNDSSYRELEAWAARYSHSLPRRRRIEAELRGATQGFLEGSRAPERDNRSGTDPRIAALQQVIHSSNIRESGLWDRSGRQRAPTYYPSHTPVTDTGHMLNMKEKTSYRRSLFGQPPGYIAPPPYNSPQKSSPMLHQSDSSWEQEGKRQACWSHPTLRKEDTSVDDRKGDKEDFKKTNVDHHTFPVLEALKHQRQETDALQESSPINIQKSHIQFEGMLSLQQPQVLHTAQNKKINEEPSSKVIEGRKFRLNKKTGGMTIFCLVSRKAGTSEIPSLPISTLQKNTELGGTSKGLRESGDSQAHKLADEVDFRIPTLSEQSNTFTARNINDQQKETPICIESEMLVVNLSNKAEADVLQEKAIHADCTFGRQVSQSAQSASVKYPLWREPSFPIRSETDSSSTCLKANCEEGESDVLHNQEVSVEVHPTDTESEDSKGLLVVDTTCVVVKMEQISSPMKEHVHYLDSTPHTQHNPPDILSTVSPECVLSNSQLNQDVKTDQNVETEPLHNNERPETEQDSDEKKAPEGESGISILCMSTFSVSERETLEERAERILGIPLHDCITEQQPEDATSFLDFRVEDEGVQPFPIKGTDSDAAKEFPEDTTEEEQSQIQLEFDQTEDAVCLQENDDAKDQVANGESFARCQEQMSTMSEENNTDLQPITDIKVSPEIEMTQDRNLKSASEEGTTEQSQKENPLVENENSSQHPSQCFSPPPDFSSLLSPSLDCEAPNLAPSLMLSSSDLPSLLYISESNMEESPHPGVIALNLPETLAPHPTSESQQLTPSLPVGFPLHTEHSPSPSPLDLVSQTAEDASSIKDLDKEVEASQLMNNEISEKLAKHVTEELVSQQHFERGQPFDAICLKEINVANEQQTKEANKAPTDHILEQIQENAAEVNVLQLQCVQEEAVVCVKESSMTEEKPPTEVKGDPADQIQRLEIFKENAIEVNILQQQSESYLSEKQPPKEVNKGPTDLLEQTISQENMTDFQSQTEVNILQDQYDNRDEDASCIKEIYMTEDKLQKEVDEDTAGLLQQKISKANATDSQNEIKIEYLLNIEPQDEPSNSSPPSPSDSALNAAGDAAPAVAMPDTVPSPLHLVSCEEPLKFSSSSSSDSPPVLLPGSSPPLTQEGSGSVSSDTSLKEEPQYPKSLWDAVNRIRKHTAPDSENEEEEVNELWDPESVGEDLGCPDVVQDMHFEKRVSDEAGQQEVSTEGSIDGVEVGKIQQDPCQEQLCGYAKEDTLSCSSSHCSENAIIVADEDKNMPPNGETELKMVNDEEFQMAEGEQCCSVEVKDETTAKEENDDGGQCHK